MKSFQTPARASFYAPVMGACIMAVLLGVAWLSKPATPCRLSRAEKKEARRLKRKLGRKGTKKRVRSKRKEFRTQLLDELGMEEFRERLAKERREKEEQLSRLRVAMDDPDALKLAVDLSWAEEHGSGKELGSLAKQLCYVYSRVKASLAPVSLTLTSYRGRAAIALESAGAGAWLARREHLGLFSSFETSSLIYLSPDADDALEEVTAGNVYVVGGIVDRTIRNGISKTAAEAGGARKARLPFDEHLPEIPRRDRVLTICACVGVLIAVHRGESWSSALEKSVPRRGLAYAARKARSGAWRGVAAADGANWGAGKQDLTPVPGESETRVTD